MEDMWFSETEREWAEALGIGEDDLLRLERIGGPDMTSAKRAPVMTEVTEAAPQSPQQEERATGSEAEEAVVLVFSVDGGENFLEEEEHPAQAAEDLEETFGNYSWNLIPSVRSEEPVRAEKSWGISGGPEDMLLESEGDLMERELVEVAWHLHEPEAEAVADEIDAAEAEVSFVEPEIERNPTLYGIYGDNLFEETKSEVIVEVREESPALFGLGGENLLTPEEEAPLEIPGQGESQSNEMLLLGEGTPANLEVGLETPAPIEHLEQGDHEEAEEVHAESVDPVEQNNLSILTFAFEQMGRMTTRFRG